jgi:acyl-CoA reductase-like NAD-dependent aldehyde dehydrogenase
VGGSHVVKRGDILREIAILMRTHRATIADLVARETGKSKKDALGETDAAIEMGFFVAGEGRRFYGQTTTERRAEQDRRSSSPAARRRGPHHRGQHARSPTWRGRRFRACCAATRPC